MTDRMEDPTQHAAGGGEAGADEAGALSALALDWLRQVLHSEFATPPDFRQARAAAADPPSRRIPERLFARDPFDVAARYARGEVENALWYREWHRRWRRFQLADQLVRFQERLRQARVPEDVYGALTEHAVQVVGGYTCVLFPPQATPPLRPLPNPLLRVDAGRLTISMPLPGTGIIAREDVVSREAGPLADLAPLFFEERAVSLAHASFGEGGVILLLERRQERVFTPEDRELLRLLALQAAAALARVRQAERTDVLRDTDARTGLLAEAQLGAALEHALAVAAQGEPLTVVVLALEGLARMAADDGQTAAERVRRTVAEVLRELVGTLGLALRRADDEFVLVLPRLTAAQAEILVGRLRRQLPARVQVHAGSAMAGADVRSADELLERAAAAAARPSTR